MVITFLQSVLSVTPVIFVKFGQKAVGAIDFSMKSSLNDTSSIKGNVNFYNIDPFLSQYHPESQWLPENDTIAKPTTETLLDQILAANDNDDEKECNPCKK